MNRGLVLKSVRELWLITVGVGVILALIEGLLTYVLATFQRQFTTQLLDLPFAQSMVAAMVGADQGSGPPHPMGMEVFGGVPWVHPVVLAFVLGHAIASCTRIPAGEVDRGTIDVLLGMPVSRWQIYIADSVIYIGAGAFLVAMACIGNLIASQQLEPALRQNPGRIAITAVSLLAVCLVVATVSSLCSALSNRKGRAMAAAISIVLASVLINYLAQLWKPARDIAFLSPLHYHKPMEILATGAWPWKNLAVLVGASAVLWAMAGVIFARRDLSTL